MISNVLLTLFFVALNAFFVAAEFAVVKVRASLVELRIREGVKLAKVVRHLVLHLDEYLSATQLGITLASLGLGWIGESVVTELIIQAMTFFGFEADPALAHKIALPAAFVTITILHIVFGELAPKSMAIQKPEQVSFAVAIPLRLFYLIFKPFIWLLNSFANRFIRLLGFEAVNEEKELHTPDELRYLIEESAKSGVIKSDDRKIFENIFDFSDTPVKQIMVPRNRIVGIDISMNADQIIETFIEEGYSRLPVYKNNIDEILGVIYAKDIISMKRYENLIILQDIMRPAFFTSEEEKIDKLLRNMQRNRVLMAVVLDEFGGVAGVVTLEDIIEEIVGEIQDEYDDEKPDVEKISDNLYNVLASAAIDDANDFLPSPLPESEDYETVAGLVIDAFERLPDQGEKIEIGDYVCVVAERSKTSVESLQFYYSPEKSADEDSSSE